jgi:hypothetical protein
MSMPEIEANDLPGSIFIMSALLLSFIKTQLKEKIG